MRWHAFEKPKQSPLKLLLWAAVIAFLTGLVNLSSIPEDLLRTSRNKLHMQAASGDIVLVAVDDQSLKKVGRWPWSRRHHATIVDNLTSAGASKIFLDFMFSTKSDPEDDRIFADSLRRSKITTLPVESRDESSIGNHLNNQPLQIFQQYADVASLTVPYNYQNAVWAIPYALQSNGRMLPSFSVKMAGVRPNNEKFFKPDYSIDPKTVPVISAEAVISGKFDRSLVRDKTIIVGATSEFLNDIYFIPGTGKLGGPYIHVIGAETLKSGTPLDLGWWPCLIITTICTGLAVHLRSATAKNAAFLSIVTILVSGPVFLEANLVFVDVVPGLLTVLITASVLARRRLREGGLVNQHSGLPNLNALLANRQGRDRAVIAARILNYAEIIATLPSDDERKLVAQIVARLSVGSADRVLYQGDGGIFAWFEDPRLPFANHLEALYALFRNPARVSGLPLDMTISFGVELGSNRSLANRLASALVAADEAAHDGLKWKYHDPETLQNASWKLSMLSQLDQAVDKGEIWVAYQPKLDLKTREIIGAEALARWTHPEKGPIAATEFIAAAEQHDRIGKLTDFVLEQAIRAGASINRKRPGFNIAVNISAKLLADTGLTLRLAAMLARHGLKSEYLTLELTETAALTDTGSAIEMLASLKEIGVGISIDDYGTGLSTLDYLKKVPANEIKIDQSFVKSMLDNRSDRLMVQSTIGLAHSLGRKVVAEGVELRETLDALVEMECDVAQGFIVGRPMSIESLMKRVSLNRKSSAA